MISTVLVEYAWAVPLVFLVLLLGCSILGVILLKMGVRGQRILGWLIVLNILAVLALTLIPNGRQSEVFCTVQFARPSLGAVESLANIIILFPAVYFLALLTRRPVLIVLLAFTFSAVIELTQAFIPIIGRACDTTDFEMNAIGAIAGTLLAWVVYMIHKEQQ
jgi:VanZ family protein